MPSCFVNFYLDLGKFWTSGKRYQTLTEVVKLPFESNCFTFLYTETAILFIWPVLVVCQFLDKAKAENNKKDKYLI